EYLNLSIHTMRVILKNFKVVELPREVTLNNRKGATMVMEGTIVVGYFQVRIKQIIYAFLKGPLVYTVSFVDKVESFESNLSIAQKAIESFTLK
ncbi:MAG: hypothetical protein JSW40_01405, partial [Candidatus Omnitrophota bacterium]